MIALVLMLSGCAASSAPAIVGTPTAAAVSASPPSADATILDVSDEASFESLRLSGRPTVLAVLDPTNT
jgi:hypothetical protein